jgi:urease accessory protein
MAAEPPAPAGAALLELIWLASPALPVGGFSYSEGLEAAVDAGRVADESGAALWLADQLHLVLAHSELPLAAAAVEAWRAGDLARITALNDWALHTRETAELRRQTEQMGRSLALWLRQRDEAAARGADPQPAVAPVPGAPPAPTAPGAPADPRVAQLAALAPAPCWPVAFALAAARSGAAPRDALLALAFSWAENQVQAAVKGVPLGQAAGQRLLGALAAAIPAAVDEALARAAQGPDGWQAFAPMLAVLSSRHEVQYSRLFRS